VLADWWFSLALSKDIYQPMTPERARSRRSLLTHKVIALSESQLLKGLSAIASSLEKACLMGVALKTF
jgi:hypothetical protein